MKALFINPYLNTLGGGEKYMLDIAHVLMLKGFSVIFAWHNKDIKSQIIDRFGTRYSNIHIDTKWHKKNTLGKITATQKLSLLIYQPDGSYPFSLAKHNIALLQIPNIKLLPHTYLHKLAFINYTPVFNSHFVKRFFQKYIPNARNVIYPIVSDNYFLKMPQKKEKIILSVGRFFKHLHSKKQEMLIKSFKTACRKYPAFKKYKLILAGNMQNEDKEYVEYLHTKIGENKNISLYINIPYEMVLNLYKRANFYWHAAGWGENEKKHPEKVEHFGISIIEAMAAGTIPFAFRAGGPKETILHKKTGFLYKTSTELINFTYQCIKNKKQTDIMRKKTQNRAQSKFSYTELTNSIDKII